MDPAKSPRDLRVISALTNKGELRWMPFDGAIKAPSLIRFMQRLVADAGRKVFLILDNLPVHRARAAQDRLAGRRAEIEVFHMPPYSPFQRVQAASVPTSATTPSAMPLSPRSSWPDQQTPHRLASWYLRPVVR